MSIEENENNSIESIEAARFLPNILHEIIFSKVIYVIDLPLTLKERKSPGELIEIAAYHSHIRCTHKRLQMGSQITERLPFEIKACHTHHKGLHGTWQEN